MAQPLQPKLYHIVHVDRLPSIILRGLHCDATVVKNKGPGTNIGMGRIKERRLNELTLASHPKLYVGECVPFYFCPRSIMLFLISRANHEDLAYKGGQGPIVHLEVDLYRAVQWSEQNGKRWAFTLSNAGARYFEDRKSLDNLNEIDWDAVQTNKWSGAGVDSSVKEGKQAEFLVEGSFPWHLVERIGVQSAATYAAVVNQIPRTPGQHVPVVEVKRDWYY